MSSGVRETVDVLENTLISYIEAQYHIRNEALIEERSKLLREPQQVWQRPYIEATPSYKVRQGYSDLQIPDLIRTGPAPLRWTV